MIFSNEHAIQNVMDDVAWSTWTPTWSAGGGTLTTITLGTAKYRLVGKFVEFFVLVTTTNIGTGTFDLRFTLPFTGATSGTFSATNQNSGRLCEGISTSTLGIMWTYFNTFPSVNGEVLSASGRFRIS